MKTLIICISVHQGNTRKVAERMAKVLDADMISPNDFDVKELKRYDLIGLGSGIYDYKHHVSLLKLAENLPDLNRKRVFLFSTSGIIRKSFHDELKRRLSEKNAVMVDDFYCKGFNKNNVRDNLNFLENFAIDFLQWIGGMNKGRPNEEDLKKAEEFAKGLKE